MCFPGQQDVLLCQFLVVGVGCCRVMLVAPSPGCLLLLWKYSLLLLLVYVGYTKTILLYHTYLLILFHASICCGSGSASWLAPRRIPLLRVNPMICVVPAVHVPIKLFLEERRVFVDSCGFNCAGLIRSRARSACRSNFPKRLSGKYGGVLLNPAMK